MIDGEDMRQAAMLIKSGALAAFGGMVGYLVDVTHGQKTFSWIGYGVFVLTAFFVGQILDCSVLMFLGSRVACIKC